MNLKKIVSVLAAVSLSLASTGMPTVSAEQTPTIAFDAVTPRFSEESSYKYVYIKVGDYYPSIFELGMKCSMTTSSEGTVFFDAGANYPEYQKATHPGTTYVTITVYDVENGYTTSRVLGQCIFAIVVQEADITTTSKSTTAASTTTKTTTTTVLNNEYHMRLVSPNEGDTIYLNVGDVGKAVVTFGNGVPSNWDNYVSVTTWGEVVGNLRWLHQEGVTITFEAMQLGSTTVKLKNTYPNGTGEYRFNVVVTDDVITTTSTTTTTTTTSTTTTTAATTIPDWVTTYEGVVDYGMCGETAYWTIDQNGLLRINGSGAMNDYTREDGYGYYSESRPWNKYAPAYSFDENDLVIKDIVVDENITAIGDCAFTQIRPLETVTILNPRCEIRSSNIAPPSAFGNAKGLTICNHIADSDAGYSMAFFWGVIKGYAGSTAQAYAESLYEYRFEAIDGDPLVSTTTAAASADTTTTTTATTTSSTQANVIRIKANQTTAVEIAGIPEDAEVVWANDDPAVAYVENGILSAVSSGETKVYGVYGGKLYSYTVKVLSDKFSLGDVNEDKNVDATDSSDILSAYAAFSTGGSPELNKEQLLLADVNNDGAVDASDASEVLSYYALISTGGTVSAEEFFK